MSMEWHERVPKSKDRDKLLESMGEGKYLGILRKAALRQYPDRSDVLKQTYLAKALSTKPGKLRDMESGHRPAPLQVCQLYCEKMGVPITVLKRVGKGRLLWDGDTPSDPEPVSEPVVPVKPRQKREHTEEEKERQRAARAANRVLDGGDTEIDLSGVKTVKLRNHLEWNLVAELKVTPGGTLMVNVFAEGDESKPSELLATGFTGVRVALPQTIVYDYDSKRKVTEVNVPATKVVDD